MLRQLQPTTAPSMAKSKVLTFAQCMRLMRKHDAQLQEDGFHALLQRAREFVPELMHEFAIEQDHGLRCWILELLGEARDERAIATLVQQLESGDESLRDWAIHGLRQLDTRESRRILFDAGLSTPTGEARTLHRH